MDLARTDAVVAIQDLGAAGLTSAVAECAGRVEGAGALIDLSKVPRRERGMTPYDVMLSESQERMLVVVEPGRQAGLAEVFAKWDLEASVIGEVTADGQLVVADGDAEVARLPVELLKDGAPVRLLEARPDPGPPLGWARDRLGSQGLMRRIWPCLGPKPKPWLET